MTVTASTSTVELWSETWAKKTHSRTQRKLIAFFVAQEADLGTYCFPETACSGQAHPFFEFRMCAFTSAGRPQEQVFRTPPFLVVEILSRDDRASGHPGESRRLSRFRRALCVDHRPSDSPRLRPHGARGPTCHRRHPHDKGPCHPTGACGAVRLKTATVSGSKENPAFLARSVRRRITSLSEQAVPSPPLVALAPDELRGRFSLSRFGCGSFQGP